MRANQAFYSVRRMCALLGVSASGYYSWKPRPRSRRAKSDEKLLERIRSVHERSHGTYGAPRIRAELAASGISVGRKRVARLMREAGLQGASRRRWATTTVRDKKVRPAPDLVDRDFLAEGRDRLWVADITYIPTWAGFLYLAVVMDAWSRRVVGWSMATHLRTELVLEALNMALEQRRPEGVIHHSIKARSTPPSPSACVAARPGCAHRWVRWVTASTTLCARASLRPWSASCSIGDVSRTSKRPGWPSSSSSRAGTTCTVGTRLWAT